VLLNNMVREMKIRYILLKIGNHLLHQIIAVVMIFEELAHTDMVAAGDI
jgi:hypothetical protein